MSEETTKKEKGKVIRLIKMKSFDDWRADVLKKSGDGVAVSVATESKDVIDKFLFSLPWNKLLGYEFDVAEPALTLNKNVFMAHAREAFKISSSVLRDRLLHTLSVIGAYCLNAALKTVVSTKKSRIMPCHLEAVTESFLLFLNGKWVGTESKRTMAMSTSDDGENEMEQQKPPKKKKKKAAVTESVE